MLNDKIQETNSQLMEKIQNIKKEFLNHKKEREFEKERERRRKGMRKFGRTRLKHSTMGVRSCEYAVGGFFLFLICVLISYLCNGKAGGFIGGMGVINFAIAVCGIRFAIKGRKERDKNYITCKIGIIGNGILVLVLGSIFVGGFF